MEFEIKVLSKELSVFLYESGLTIGTAESCTGGRVASAIISSPGSSAYFKGGIVSYVDETKERLLGVSPEILSSEGAVSEAVAREMAIGACKALNVDYALAVTGFAGPGGGTTNAPVGTIWLSCGNETHMVTQKLTEDHGRDLNLTYATEQSLRLLLDFLRTSSCDNKENNKSVY